MENNALTGDAIFKIENHIAKECMRGGKCNAQVVEKTLSTAIADDQERIEKAFEEYCLNGSLTSCNRLLNHLESQNQKFTWMISGMIAGGLDPDANPELVQWLRNLKQEQIDDVQFMKNWIETSKENGYYSQKEINAAKRDEILTLFVMAFGGGNSSAKGLSKLAGKLSSIGKVNAATNKVSSPNSASGSNASPGNTTPELPALPPGKPGSVIKNELLPHEYEQALDIVRYKGGTFKGAIKKNQEGIDGWLDNVPVQLKTVTGKSIHAIRGNIIKGAENMAKTGYKGDLYIDATKTGVSMDEMIKHFKPGSPVSNITKEGTVNHIYIKTKDGWLCVTGG